ncbi:MAG: protein kinase, partial [Polyangiaceae bacterium]
MAKKTFVSTADMGPQLVQAGAETTARAETREARAAKALGVEILGLARERPLSSTWRVRRTKDAPIVALVVVSEAATEAERELFARMAEDVRAAGDALPGILRVRGIASSRDAFLTDLWTTGTARDMSALKWPPRRRVEFVLEVVRALERLHEVGLVHGCLCPANVLLDDDLKPVVAEAGTVSIPALLERKGDAALYAAFAAPEVTSGGKVDARSDLFSAGRILDYVTKGDDSPDALKEIIKRCSYPDVGARYASAAELATALEGVVGLVSDAEAAAPAPPAPAPAPARPAAE